MADKVFTQLNENSDCPLILTCEHASAQIPEEYHNLGLPAEELNRHIARDKGVKEITELLAKELGCFAIMGGYSRLLIDLNRRPEEDELIVKTSDMTHIPENENLSDAERQKRLDVYYKPYYAAIERQIEYLQKQGKTPVIFSIHSYTPQLKGGDYRPWHAGILWHKPAKLASFLFENLSKNKDKFIGENVPYDLRKYNTGAAVICGEEKGFDYGLIEIRDDEFDNLEQGAAYWSNRLGILLRKFLFE